MALPDETQRPIHALRNSNAWGNGNREGRFFTPGAYGGIAFVEPGPILLPGNRQRLREFAGTVCQTCYGATPLAAFKHFGDARNWFERPNENTAGLPFSIGNHIKAFVHTVDEIDVGAAGRPKQDPGALGTAAGCVSSQVLQTEIGLGLHDDTCGSAMYQKLAEQIARQFVRRALKLKDIQWHGLTFQTIERMNIRGVAETQLLRYARTLTRPSCDFSQLSTCPRKFC